jgi:hypothetical protein
MYENYCHLINITNAILSYTSIGFIDLIKPLSNLDEIGDINNCNNINRLDICKSYNKTFFSIKVIPIYKKIVELLKTSLELTLDCKSDETRINNNNNKIVLENRISRIKMPKLNYYHVLFYSILLIILYNLILFFKNKIHKIK